MSAPKKIIDAAGRPRWEIRVAFRTGNDQIKQMKRRFATEKEAKTELIRISHEVNQGVYVHPDATLTVKALADRWTAAKATDRKQSTRRFYEDALRPLLERHGDLPVVKLTDQHLIALRDEMLSGKLRRVGTPGAPMSARSANAMLGAVHGLLGYGVTLRVLARNVAEKELVARVRNGNTEVDERRAGWGDAELRKFRIAVAGDWLEASWLLSAQGLRRGEVLGLKWSDVDWEGGRITIRRTRTYVAGEDVIGTPKSRSSQRTLKMGDAVMDALQCQRARQSINPGGWVTVDAAGVPITHEWYSDEIQRLSKAHGLPCVVLHGVRHAVATTMAAKGIPLADVAQWLGQSQASLATTLGYIHGSDVSGDAIRDALGG